MPVSSEFLRDTLPENYQEVSHESVKPYINTEYVLSEDSLLFADIQSNTSPEIILRYDQDSGYIYLYSSKNELFINSDYPKEDIQKIGGLLSKDILRVQSPTCIIGFSFGEEHISMLTEESGFRKAPLSEFRVPVFPDLSFPDGFTFDEVRAIIKYTKPELELIENQILRIEYHYIYTDGVIITKKDRKTNWRDVEANSGSQEKVILSNETIRFVHDAEHTRYIESLLNKTGDAEAIYCTQDISKHILSVTI